MIPHAFRLLTAVGATIALLPALSHAAPPTEQNMITIKDFHFSPVSLTVSTGTTIYWRNLDGEPHTVVSDSGLFRSGGLDQNDVFNFKFDSPGTYKFICSIHPAMMGTIVVK
jgi:plastocyanin